MLGNAALTVTNSFSINVLRNIHTMIRSFVAPWYQAPNMVSVVLDAIDYAIKKWCLAMQKSAGQCQTQKQKSPHFCGLACALVLDRASPCRTPNHSHSIVPGGFDV